MLPAAWEQMVAESPEVAPSTSAEDVDHTDPTVIAEWLRGAQPLLQTYFAMEDPAWLNPAHHRELHVEFDLPDGPVAGFRRSG